MNKKDVATFFGLFYHLQCYNVTWYMNLPSALMANSHTM